MEDTLISFETAKLAKEKGFDQLNQGLYYTNDKNHCLLGWGFNDRTETSFAKYSAPTQSLLQKWLREKHTIHVLVWNNHVDVIEGSFFPIMNYDLMIVLENPTNFKTYEEALEQGLLEGLKLIK